MQTKINNNIYDIELIRKNNKNTYIRVKNGKIIVTTNYLTPNKSILKLINDNIDSINKMLDRDIRRNDKKELFYYFGKVYDVIYGFNDIEFTNDKIYASTESALKKYIDASIYRIYDEKLKYYYNVFEENIPVPNLKIRKMTSRWGVCNIKNNNITLNYMLYRYDICCLEYVIIHELSHFVYHNHSKEFWTLVEKYCPKYKIIRKMLKE